MKISQEGVDLIKRFEGYSSVAYLCPAGVWTIGYGHTDKDIHKGDTITEEDAQDLLRDDLIWVEEAINRKAKSPMKQHQFDALCSLVYNIGATAFTGSTLLRLLNAGNYDAIPAQFGRWNKANGKPLAGLIARREAERALWES